MWQNTNIQFWKQHDTVSEHQNELTQKLTPPTYHVTPRAYTLDGTGTRRPLLSLKHTLGMTFLTHWKNKLNLSKNKTCVKKSTSYDNYGQNGT